MTVSALVSANVACKAYFNSSSEFSPSWSIMYVWWIIWMCCDLVSYPDLTSGASRMKTDDSQSCWPWSSLKTVRSETSDSTLQSSHLKMRFPGPINQPPSTHVQCDGHLPSNSNIACKDVKEKQCLKFKICTTIVFS